MSRLAYFVLFSFLLALVLASHCWLHREWLTTNHLLSDQQMQAETVHRATTQRYQQLDEWRVNMDTMVRALCVKEGVPTPPPTPPTVVRVVP